MPARQTVLKPLGLITRPNELGAYPPGAMAVADNVLFRSAGQMVVTKTAGGATTLGAANDIVRKLFPLDSGSVWSATRTAANVWSLAFGGSAGVMPTGMSSTSAFSDTGFIAPIRMRDHFLVNGTAAVIVSDVMAPASAADRTFRCAGMPPPTVILMTTIATGGGAVAPSTTVGYQALFRRDYANDYQVVSTPSLVWRVSNTAVVAVNTELTIAWDTTSGIRAGDLIELYRTDAVDAALSTTDPGTTCKLVLTHTLTAANIATGSVAVLDTQVPGGLGETFGRELYTNPGQQGALAANRQPNICKQMSQYKGYAFFANLVERPIWVFSVPAGMGDSLTGLVTDYERTHGIGLRNITGNSTLGNSTLTGVSASHMLGIVPGQQITIGGGAFTSGVGQVVVSVGASTITFSAPAIATVVGASMQVADTFQIDGRAATTITSLGGMLAALGRFTFGGGSGGGYEMTCDQPVTPEGANPPAQAGFTVTVEPSRPWYATTITIRATNGANYEPAVPEISATVKTFTQTPRPNMLAWSHEQQPEHAPPSNTAFVGAGSIIGLASTRDALWIFCTDGLFRLSGDGGQWRIDQLDTTLVLSAPQCATVLRDSVFAYTNRGLVRIADDGFDELSDLAIGNVLVGPAYVETAALIVERDETYDEIHVVDTGVSGGTPTLYLYASIYNAWSKITITSITALAYQRIPTNPATQPNGWMVIGRSPQAGVAPSMSLFDQAVGTANLTAVIQYQPWYSDDPLVLKHWIDATWIFALADATRSISSSWLGVADGTATLVAQINGDARASFGVPRSAAIAPALSPGLTITAGSFVPPTCKGLSVRFQPLTEQQAYR